MYFYFIGAHVIQPIILDYSYQAQDKNLPVKIILDIQFTIYLCYISV